MKFFFSIFYALVQLTVSTRVQLSSGIIEGKLLNSTYSPFGNQSAIVFFGIPYVEPPLGDLRFRKPRPSVRWDGILETKAYKPACMSNAKKTYKNDEGGPISEDCLYANVFTNRYCMEVKNCAVMIAIHGGMFAFESASAFNPEILINNFVGQGRNIVLVSLNYRLGVFGIGHFNGDEGDTNVALFDILEGVKWVRKEIHNFGGNKDRITLAGHSAGGAITAVLTLSPLTKGLIHQQIVMSGPVTIVSRKMNFKFRTVMAQRVNCLSKLKGFQKLSKQEIEKTYSCLRTKSAQELLDAQLWMLENSTYYLTAPHVDGEFIVDYPENVYASIFPVNTLIGTTTKEMQDAKYINEPKNAGKKGFLLTNLCEHIGYELYSKPEVFTEKCVNWYKDDSAANSLTDDMEFYSKTVTLANAHSSNNTKVFVYSYAYSGAGPAFKKYMDVSSPHHSEDLIYVFGTHRGPFTSKDYVIESIYSGFFANFVNFGRPTLSENQPWLQYTPEKREYFLVDFDEKFTMPGMKSNYYGEAFEFWSSAGMRSFREHWSPSLDGFISSNLIDPIVSHMNRASQDAEKSLEMCDELYKERENFLIELKAERMLEELKKSNTMKKHGYGKRTIERTMKVGSARINTENDETGTNTILIIFAGILLAILLYVSASHFSSHIGSRERYERLK